MIDPAADWPYGPVDVDRPEPWPPTEEPPEWPNGADPDYVYLEATWGDEHCQYWMDVLRKRSKGIAVDGEHVDLAAFGGAD